MSSDWKQLKGFITRGDKKVTMSNNMIAIFRPKKQTQVVKKKNKRKHNNR